MRKSMKKLIALTLACLMLATLFVGCGKKDDGGSSGGDTIKLGEGDYICYPADQEHVFQALEPDTQALLVAEQN